MSPQHLYEFGPFRLDTAEQQLLRDGKPVPLTPKAFETLVALVQRRGHLVGKDELMKAVWSDAFVEESNLTNNVYTLRKLLGDAEDGRSYIETVPKRGYRFAAPVRQLSPDALVIEKRTVTRIVTEETDNEPQGIVAPTVGRQWTSNAVLLTVGAIAIVGVATFGSYRLLGNRSRSESTPAVPFATIDISRVTTSGNITHTAVSGDGKYVANVVRDASGSSLWVKHQDAPSNVRVAGPELTEYISVTFGPRDSPFRDIDSRLVVGDEAHSLAVGDRAVDRNAQVHVEGFIWLALQIAVHQNADSPARLAGGDR
jgi:DNA-binding winged helix-turn-helix (wHTH) protein